MKEIRAIGLIPFHQSIMKLCIQRLLLLQSKTPSYALFNLSLMPFSFLLAFHNDKKRWKGSYWKYMQPCNLPLNIAFCQGKHNKNWTIFNLIKLLFDTNVVKIFLKSSFYHYVENCCKRFCHTLMGHHFNPSPSGKLAINWDKT